MEKSDDYQEKNDMQKEISQYKIDDEARMADIGIRVTRDIVREDFPLHTHDFHETFIIVSGSADHVLGGHAYPLHRGDVFAIKGDTAHGFQNVRNLDIINLMYKPDFFDRPYLEIRSIPGFDAFFLIEPEIRLLREDSPMLRLEDKALDYVVTMSDFILEQQARNSEALYPVIRMHFTALVSYLATQYDVGGRKAPQVSALSRALAFMERNLEKPIRLSDVADSVFLSPRQLERLFYACYQESPMKHLQTMRLKKALMLLVRQGETVASAARQCGFEDASYFTRVFRAAYGITPSAARKLLLDI